jgi:hypothetical protein
LRQRWRWKGTFLTMHKQKATIISLRKKICQMRRLTVRENGTVTRSKRKLVTLGNIPVIRGFKQMMIMMMTVKY